MRWFWSLILNCFVLLAVAGLLDSVHIEKSISAVLLTSIVISVLNVIVKPILVLITLPVTFLTLGLFLFVVNGITLLIADAVMGAAFNVNGFGAAIWASIIISFFNMVLQKGILDRFYK
ncbi:MAG: phage holin family protein [Bacillaceae bacterium]